MRISSLALLFFLAARAAFGAGTVTQTFTLQPGWNAIHLEVQPADPAPAAVFAGVPIDMVWSYFPTRSPLEFIQNPSDGLWNVPGWNVWLPPGRTDAAVLTNLFAVQAYQSYLVKITGTSAVTLSVTGAPRYHQIAWQPDGFTLTGLPLDPAVTVRSGDYFFNSTAHKTQPRFRLDPNGTWIALNDNSVLRSGAAYWIFSKGASTFTAPLAADFDATGRLDYGPAVETKQLAIRNLGVNSLAVSLANPEAFPLVIAGLDANGNTTWTPLTTLVKTIASGASTTLNLGVRRSAPLP